MPQPTLPTKPSDLLKLALADLALVEDDANYTVDMNIIHCPSDGTCYVCLMGSVIAETMSWSPSTAFHWDSVHTQENQNGLRAIGCFQMGWVASGLKWLGLSDPNVASCVVIPDYATDAAGFKAALNALAVVLAENGF